MVENKLKENKVNNKVVFDIDPREFCKKFNIGCEGKIIDIYARKASYSDKVEVTIEIEIEDKLTQINYSKKTTDVSKEQ